jgi:aspartyl-tRNA(Asn)/glutamyl-tRNA(Gln) amidotransferase subunit A
MNPGLRSPASRREFVLTGLAVATYAALPASAFPQTTGDKSGERRDLATLTLKQASDLLRRRDVSPVDLVEACLSRIERHDRAINAFITITREQALSSAREMERELRRGRPRGPLYGIPIALKDNIDTAGVLTTCGYRKLNPSQTTSIE